MFGHATCFVPISASAITSSPLVAAMVARAPPMFSPQPSPISPQSIALSPVLSHSSYPPLFNIGSGEDLTICELAETVAEVVCYKGRFVQDTSKPDGAMRKVMDVSRINSLGWKRKILLKDIIAPSYQDMLIKR